MELTRRNNISIRGDGPATMFFAHGFGCDQNMWRLLAPHFEDKYRLVLFDLVGSGGSDVSAYDPEKYASLDGYAQDFAELIEEFAAGPSIIVGHSVSAMIGALADLRLPGKIAAQIMLGPSPCYINDGDYIGGFTREDIESLLDTLEGNYLGWASQMAPVIMGAPDQPELGVELTNSFCQMDPEIAQQFARVTFLSDVRDILPRLETPTLILQCSDDVIAPMEVGQYMERVLPNATLAVVENEGHCPHLSSPGASSDTIDEFLSAQAF